MQQKITFHRIPTIQMTRTSSEPNISPQLPTSCDVNNFHLEFSAPRFRVFFATRYSLASNNMGASLKSVANAKKINCPTPLRILFSYARIESKLSRVFSALLDICALKIRHGVSRILWVRKCESLHK